MHIHSQATDFLDIANHDCSHVVPNTTQYKRIVGVQSVADITTNTGKDRNAQNGCKKCTIQEAREQWIHYQRPWMVSYHSHFKEQQQVIWSTAVPLMCPMLQLGCYVVSTELGFLQVQVVSVLQQ